MSGPVIDLGAVRATRAAELRAVQEMTSAAVADVVAMAEAFATRAFAISGPVRLVAEQLAVDINRSQYRRVLVIVRRATRKGVPDVRQQFRDLAGQTFANKLWDLIYADDARRGLPRTDLPVGGMWVAAGHQPWKVSSWPTVTGLGRLGTLAWMTHIEHTPYRMKPATRALFDAARKEMQGGVTWPGTEAERMLDRIIRTCWQRGWRPEEKAA